MSKKRAFTAQEWAKFRLEVAKILKQHAGVLAGPMGDEGTKPEVTGNYVSFNGIGDDHHETCRIDKQGSKFEFCKTAHKPYDEAVVQTYALVRTILGAGGVELSSDGGDEVFNPTPQHAHD